MTGADWTHVMEAFVLIALLIWILNHTEPS